MKLFKSASILLGSLALAAVSYAGELALDGYCPVCYVAIGEAKKGDAKFTTEHDGKKYQFVSEDVKNTFIANPQKFLPQYDGFCAYGVAKGKKLEADPTVFSVVDGKLYLNYNEDIAKKFKKDPKGFIATADKNWPTLMKQ